MSFRHSSGLVARQKFMKHTLARYHLLIVGKVAFQAVGIRLRNCVIIVGHVIYGKKHHNHSHQY